MRFNWLPYGKALAEGLIQFAGPLGALAKGLLTLADELEKEENAEKAAAKAEEMRQMVRAINDQLPALAERVDIEQLRSQIDVLMDGTAATIITAIKVSNVQLAEELEEMRTLLEGRLPVSETPPPPEDIEKARQKYVQFLCDNCRTLQMRGVRVDEPVSIDLQTLYRDLRIRAGLDTQAEPVAAKQVLSSYTRIVLLSPPGGGKTTFLNRIVLSLEADEAVRKFGLPRRQLPIYLPLAALAKQLTARPPDQQWSIRPNHLLQTMHQEAESYALRLPTGFFRTVLDQGGCMVLFDGLDEIPKQRDREDLMAAIRALAVRFPDNRYLVTSRPYAYRDGATWADANFIGWIDEFNDDDVRSFVNVWYRAVRGTLTAPIDARKAEERRKDLLRAATADERIRRLTRSPLLLTQIAVVHYNSGATSRTPSQALRSLHRVDVRVLGPGQTPGHHPGD